MEIGLLLAEVELLWLAMVMVVCLISTHVLRLFLIVLGSDVGLVDGTGSQVVI